jgi:hypothetical protein
MLAVLERARQELRQRGHLQFRFLLWGLALFGLKMLVKNR